MKQTEKILMQELQISIDLLNSACVRLERSFTGSSRAELKSYINKFNQAYSRVVESIETLSISQVVTVQNALDARDRATLLLIEFDQHTSI